MKAMTQRGFTLIELVVVILILGIMAAIAVPKFFDLSTDAHSAAARGVAAALSSGSSINYAAHSANSANGVAISAANVCTVAIAQALLSGATTTIQTTAPTTNDQFQITGTGDCTLATGNTSVACTITPRSGVAASATLICVQ